MGSYLLNSSKELTSRSYNMSYGDSYRRRSRSPAYGRDRDRYDRDDRSRHNRHRQEDRRRDDRYERRRSPPRQRSGGFGGSSKKVERTKFGILCRNLSSRVNWMVRINGWWLTRIQNIGQSPSNSRDFGWMVSWVSKWLEAKIFGFKIDLGFERPCTTLRRSYIHRCEQHATRWCDDIHQQERYGRGLRESARQRTLRKATRARVRIP